MKFLLLAILFTAANANRLPVGFIDVNPDNRLPVGFKPMYPEEPCPTTQAPCPTTQAPCPTTPVPCPTTPVPCPTTPAPCPTTQAPCPTTPVPCPTTPTPCPTTADPCPPTPCPTTADPCPPTPAPTTCPPTPTPTPSTPSPITCKAPLNYEGCALSYSGGCGDFAGFQLQCNTDGNPDGQCRCAKGDKSCKTAVEQHTISSKPDYLPQFGTNCDKAKGCHGHGQLCNANGLWGDCKTCQESVKCITNKDSFHQCHSCSSCLEQNGYFNCNDVCDQETYSVPFVLNEKLNGASTVTLGLSFAIALAVSTFAMLW